MEDPVLFHESGASVHVFDWNAQFGLLEWAYMAPAVQIGFHRAARVLDTEPSKAVVNLKSTELFPLKPLIRIVEIFAPPSMLSPDWDVTACDE